MNCPLCNRQCKLEGSHLYCPLDIYKNFTFKSHYSYYGYGYGWHPNVREREEIIVMPYRLINYHDEYVRLGKHTYIDEWETTAYGSIFREIFKIPKISFVNLTEEKILNKIKTFLVFS